MPDESAASEFGSESTVETTAAEPAIASPPAIAELIPPTPEAETPALADAPEPFVSARPEHTALIPPSPEPEDLTTRARMWTEAEDPNAIELPALEPPPPVAVAPASPAPPAAPAPPPPAVELEITDVLLDEPMPIFGLGRPSRPLEGLERLAEAGSAPVAFNPTVPFESQPPATDEGREPEAEAVARASAPAFGAGADAAVIARLRAAAGYSPATGPTETTEAIEEAEAVGEAGATRATPPPFVMAPPQHPA